MIRTYRVKRGLNSSPSLHSPPAPLVTERGALDGRLLTIETQEDTECIDMLFEHDSSLTPLARTLRKQRTAAENVLWSVLRGKKFHGYKFYRQQPVASYIADFYCPKLRLIIEVDGEIHENLKERDNYRSKELKRMGLLVVRYTNQQIQTELPRVLTHLTRVADTLLSKLPSRLREG